MDFVISRSMLIEHFESDVKPFMDVKWGRYIWVGTAVDMGSVCQNCGQRIKDDNIVYDTESGEYLSFGPVCAPKMTGKTIVQFKHEKQVINRAIRRAQREEEMIELREKKVQEFQDLFQAEFDFLKEENKKDPESFLGSMFTNLMEYGTLSEKQMLYVELGMMDDLELEEGSKVELPVVYKTGKWYDSRFGSTLYATFATEGFKKVQVKVSQGSDFGGAIDRAQDKGITWTGTIKGTVKNGRLTRVKIVVDEEYTQRLNNLKD